MENYAENYLRFLLGIALGVLFIWIGVTGRLGSLLGAIITPGYMEEGNPNGGSTSNSNGSSSDLTNPVYRTIAQADAKKYGIDPDIFVRQIQQESGFNPDAVSSAGAIGIAQFLPSTAAGMGVNPRDPGSSLDGAARLDARNLATYGGDYRKMLAAYNAGGGTVDNAVARYGASWLSHMPNETQNYVKAIMPGNQGVTGAS